METLESLIERILDGDNEAFGSLVRRFQDMAVGYGYSILHDFQLAEDAAQEAFFEAYRKLASLREAAAFPGWFRRIVYKHCDRIVRGKAFSVVPLDAADHQSAMEISQLESLVQGEVNYKIRSAIDSLPEHERSTMLLYYISGYSQREVAAFLDVPVTTVKKRLFSARSRIRELLVDLIEDSLRERRPSRSEAFAKRLMDLLNAARSGDSHKVKEMLDKDPRLLAARDPLGNTALIVAINSGHYELGELLLASGIDLGLHEAAAIGKSDTVAQLLDEDCALVDSYSPEGFTPLHLAAHFGHDETTKFLIIKGADINAISKHELRVTPLHAALFGGQLSTARVLIERGANVEIRRGGKGVPRSGWTALHYAVGYGFCDLVAPLIEKGADLNAQDNSGKTPFQVAIEMKQEKVIELLGQLSGIQNRKPNSKSV